LAHATSSTRFHLAPFKGNVGGSFPRFDPTQPLDLLRFGGGQTFASVQRLLLDTQNQGGISIIEESRAADARAERLLNDLQLLPITPRLHEAAPEFAAQSECRTLGN
jgi:hypothetical protein